jgi:hypothetical protein
MEFININNQKELDSYLASNKSLTLNVISKNKLKINHQNSFITIRFYGKTKAECYGSGIYFCYDNTEVEVNDRVILNSFDNSKVLAKDFTWVESNNKSQVIAKNYSKIYSREKSIVYSYDYSYVLGRELSVIYAYDSSYVEVFNNCSVTLFDLSKVNCFEKTKIENKSNQSKIFDYRKNFYTKKDYVNLCFKFDKNHIILFKTVRENGFDFYSDSINYNIKKTYVCANFDENAENISSRGFYFCRKPLEALYYHPTGIVVKAKVNIKDLLILPKDLTQVRCKKFEVI